MTLVVVLSKNNGMLFNKRRQSRDRELISNLISLVGDGRLYITDFSKKLFLDYPRVEIISNPELLSDGDYFFCESISVQASKSIERLVIYRWDEVYPADTYFDISPSSLGLSLKETSEFAGYSHKKITREIWE